MTKKLAYLLLFWSLLLFSCMRAEVEEGKGIADGSPVEFDLQFGGSGLQDVLVTKSTLGEDAESAIYNMYAFIFDADGNKFYGKFFDGDNLGEDKQGILSDWWVIRNQSSTVSQTTGTLHIRSLAKGEGCKIVIIANIDAEMLNVSAERLKTVSSWDDLQDLRATLNQVIVSRSGHFPMTGVLENVSITRKPDTDQPQSIISPSTVSLQRLDAKIIFNVRVAGGASISSFSPITWNVVNVPKICYLLERGHYATAGPFVDAAQTSSDYFDTKVANFESETVTNDYYAGTDRHHILIHSFSFYMMENRHAPVADPDGRDWEYADRERQEKIPAGTNKVKNGDFLYAHPLSTYVEFGGRLQMAADGSDASTLSAEVHYRVHLGDFGSNLSDFNVFRNHTYIYNITIHGVDDIRVEVEGGVDEFDNPTPPEERDPGATGEVSVSRETVLTSDAHYSTHVISFHADNIDANKVTWDVVTPFNPNGATPSFTSEGNEITTGIDYEWVEFRKNSIDPTNHLYYENKRQRYSPRRGKSPNAATENPTMTVSELVTYLKQQKKLYDENPALSDFDQDESPKIVVTAFVNEYYYETNPITGKYDKELWKKVVNQPMRYMHILSETKSSADGESRVIGASFTIEQKSIQTIYDVSTPGLNSAWGSEHWDDEQNLGVHTNVYWSTTASEDRGNLSLSNGRENTLKEWLLIDKNGNNSILGDQNNGYAKWTVYLQLEASSETPLMQTGYNYLRYSCMARNRDNDGDGVIDQDEIRWYMASENQLMGLYLGSNGIEGDARLYQRDAVQMASNNKNDWRQHVFASTRYTANNVEKNSNNQARLIWAEEGLSGSSLGKWKSTNWDQTTTFSTRCVRNLGHDPSTGKSITESAPSKEPDPVIVVHRMKNGAEYPATVSSNKMDKNVYYVVDCSRLNKASIRYYTGEELVRHNEFSEQACLYTKFESVSVNDSRTFEKSTIRQINDWLDSDDNKGKANKYCPAGYRLCNLRELLVLRCFIPSGDVSTYYSGIQNVTRTWWFFGGQQPISVYKKNADYWGFIAGSDKVQKAYADRPEHATASLRCVRDVKQ